MSVMHCITPHVSRLTINNPPHQRALLPQVFCAVGADFENGGVGGGHGGVQVCGERRQIGAYLVRQAKERGGMGEVQTVGREEERREGRFQLRHGQTPEDAAAELQAGLESWYAPQQH